MGKCGTWDGSVVHVASVISKMDDTLFYVTVKQFSGATPANLLSVTKYSATGWQGRLTTREMQNNRSAFNRIHTHRTWST